MDTLDLSSTAVRNRLFVERQQRLRSTMRDHGAEVALICDPINILYATGASNMTVFTTRTPARYLLIFADGPAVLFDYRGGEHLADHLPTVDDVRCARGLCYVGTNGFVEQESAAMATEIADLVRDHLGRLDRLAIDRFPFDAVDALRAAGFVLTRADPVFDAARRIKLPIEIAYMREAMRRVEAATAEFEQRLRPGITEAEAWSWFHQPFIAQQGQYTVTRLLQSGPRTFPYFQECGERVIAEGDLVCLDTDTIGFEGYAVDFSRTFLAGDGPATAEQRRLYGRAREQLEHNVALIGPGVTFEDAARGAWPVPDEHQASRYYTLGHGLGLSGEFPNLPFVTTEMDAYPLDDVFEPGMVFCVESYVGSSVTGEGVNLEQQVLITDTGVELMSSHPFEPRLG